jgi:hypothetical protein
MNNRILHALAGGVILCATSPALAQGQGEMILYSNANFGGQRYVVTGQRNILNLGFTVRSVQMAPGDRWQLCEREQLQRCTTYNGSERATAITVRSAQPALPPPTTRPTPLPGSSTSLRGMAAEFFPAPENRFGRVFSVGTAAGAQTAANVYCRQAGWTRSAHQRLETVAGRNYLADVLCVRG